MKYTVLPPAAPLCPHSVGMGVFYKLKKYTNLIQRICLNTISSHEIHFGRNCQADRKEIPAFPKEAHAKNYKHKKKHKCKTVMNGGHLHII